MAFGFEFHNPMITIDNVHFVVSMVTVGYIVDRMGTLDGASC